MNRKHLDFLDALRGLAASYVVVYHMAMIASREVATPGSIGAVVYAGGTGVMLFFVVSAFSLYYTMPMRLEEDRPILSFYLHRFFRIAPLFYVWIMLTLVRDALYFRTTHPLMEILESMTFTFNLTARGQQGFVWASWTIGVEMIFYLMFPWLYRHIKSFAAAGVAVFVLLLATKGFNLTVTRLFSVADAASIRQWAFVRFLPVFACGIAAYFSVEWLANIREPRSRRDIGLLLISASFFMFMALLEGHLNFLFRDGRYWQALIFSTLLVGLSLQPIGLLVNRLTKFLGKISFSLYLAHPTIILFLSHYYRLFQVFRAHATLDFAMCYAVTMLVSCGVAWVTYRFVERPGIRLGRMFYRRLVLSAA